MPIYYSLIARGQTILCDASAEHGNFRAASQRILSKIPQYDAKMSYLQDEYVILIFMKIYFFLFFYVN